MFGNVWLIQMALQLHAHLPLSGSHKWFCMHWHCLIAQMALSAYLALSDCTNGIVFIFGIVWSHKWHSLHIWHCLIAQMALSAYLALSDRTNGIVCTFGIVWLHKWHCLHIWHCLTAHLALCAYLALSDCVIAIVWIESSSLNETTVFFIPLQLSLFPISRLHSITVIFIQ